jgi:tetratricopeptide (TPR) repeat protein
MRTFSPLSFLALLLLLSSCSKHQEVEVSDLARNEALHLATEAHVQTRLRDYAAAEKGLSRAVELDPNVGDYWSALGRNRMMLGDKSGAKKAYKRELAISEADAKKNPDDVEIQLSQLRPLVLLNRLDDARELITEMGRKHPQHTELRRLSDKKAFDEMVAAKEIQEAMIK